MSKQLDPVHPGEILLKDFLEPLEITSYRLAKELGVKPERIYAVVNCKESVTAETALLLAKYFGTTPRFWINLQGHYDLEVEGDRLHERLKRIAPRHP